MGHVQQKSFTLRATAALVVIAMYFHRCSLVIALEEQSNTAEGSTESPEHARDNEGNRRKKDVLDDAFLDPLQADPSCTESQGDNGDCFSPPQSTIETETILDATCFKGGDDYSEAEESQDQDINKDESSEQCVSEDVVFDKHWGNDEQLLAMRDQLRKQARQPHNDTRPPIFLIPGLASTRLVAWKFKKCKGMLGSDIKVQDNVWLNINLVIQMGAVNVQCMTECLSLGLNQSDTDDWEVGCKLRPDEGLDAIASLAPGGIGSSLLVGGTNTVYSWLIQWLADNLGYDVTNIIGLPYDWRLSPDKMETRDGFLSMTRRRIEAAVASNGSPGIMVAHSMGNLIFRYFLNWLRVQMRKEVYEEYIARARRREKRQKMADEIRRSNEEAAAERARWQQDRLDQSETDKLEDSKESGSSFENVETEGEDIASFVPGWVAAAVPGLEGVIGWVASLAATEENEESPQFKSLLEEEITLENLLEEEEDHDAKLLELAKEEGDAKWTEWIEKHIWTYIGLSAPMLGAVNPLRSVISGENMGLPISDENARKMEVTFGSTHTLNPVSIATGFCDEWNAEDWESNATTHGRRVPLNPTDESTLACLDDITNDIEYSSSSRDPWANFATLKSILRDRLDWDTIKPMMNVNVETCQENASGKNVCVDNETLNFGPRDVESGAIFDRFNAMWHEKSEPLITKREQLEESFMNRDVANMLNHTWERPLIKHVVMAYGIDIPTESGYIYKHQIHLDKNGNRIDKLATTGEDEIPDLRSVFWEEANGRIMVEPMDSGRGSLAEHFIKKKIRKFRYEQQDETRGRFEHSGDGSVPYLSLAWVHTWLLHAARARRFGGETYQDQPHFENADQKNALDHISISHRPHGAVEWVAGPPPTETEIVDPSKLENTKDTDIDHPHGTRYKPLMTRFHNVGTSRTTGTEYTTTVIEAVGVEHKETTRNYDILAAVFSDALKFMHQDLGLVGNENAE